MGSPPVGISPLAVVALDLLGDGATAAELEARFAAEGVVVERASVERWLADLSRLGLIRVGRGRGSDARLVPTSLGTEYRERLAGGEVPIALERLERLRTDLLSTIAHELRTPLTAVRTSAGLLLDAASRPSAGQRRQLLESIERNADRMQRLIADILDVSRFRSGAIRLQSRRFDPLELAASVVETIRPLADSRGQRVELCGEPSGPDVFGDRRRLERALLNLASNAQRFSPDGGRIGVRVEVDANDVRWIVSDDGPGIAPAERARLFERFFVGRSDRNAAGDGVGLGLPTALAIAQAHGGGIDVETEPGAGSTFTLRIPIAAIVDEEAG